MKTIKQASTDSGIPESLIRAIVRTVGKDYMPDVMNHGANAGFPGITYYSETVKFYKAHKADILTVARNMASELGENVLNMIAGFNCLKDYIKADTDSGTDEVGRAVYGRLAADDTQVPNALTWFAAEEVARALCDE